MDNINIKRSMSGINDERLRQHMTRIEIPQENPKKQARFSKNTKIFLMVLFLIIISIILLFIFSPFKNKLKNGWQAVFLTNNEVYFGKIINKNKYEIILNNIYYLKEAVALQQGIEGLNRQTGDFTLIKLGNEIHGPEDEMQINRENVLYVENLKENSKIVEAIKKHIEQ